MCKTPNMEQDESMKQCYKIMKEINEKKWDGMTDFHYLKFLLQWLCWLTKYLYSSNNKDSVQAYVKYWEKELEDIDD